MLTAEFAIIRKVFSLIPRAQRRRAIPLAGLLLVGSVLEMLGVGVVFLYIAVLSDLSGDGASNGTVVRWLEQYGLGEVHHAALVGGLALIGVIVLKSAVVVLMQFKLMDFVFANYRTVAGRIFGGLMRAPFGFMAQRNSSEVQRTVNVELLSAFNTCGVATMFLASNFLVTMLLCVALIVVEPVASILAAVVLCLVSAIYYWTVRRYLDRLARRRQVHMTGMLQWITQALAGFKEVRIFGRDRLFHERFVGHVAQVASADRGMRVLTNIPTLVNESILVIGVVTVIVTAVALERSLSSLLPTLAMFGVAGVRIMGMMNSMVGQIQQIRFSGRAVDSVRQMVDDLETADRLMDAKDEPPGPDLHQHRMITLDRVGFSYPDKDKIAISDVSVSIARGRRVAFVGPSGAGKSTLVGLILGLLTPSTGRVMVDGEAIVARPRAWYAQLGYVPQSIFLLDDTLRANVLFGEDSPAGGDDRVWAALEAAQLADFVRQMPEGLDTHVGENGFALSGGERQRLGIARALYRKPAVLVLDEATAALDNLTERRFSDTIMRLSGDMTIIIVAHRLSTVRGCDVIHYMEDGRILESGAYRDLVERSTGFRALVDADARVAV